MNKWLFSVVFLFLWFNPFTYISDINQYQKEAVESYNNGDNPLAISLYQKLIQGYGIESEAIHLNLAHTYFRAEVLDSAYKYYNLLIESENIDLQSIAYMQIGLLILNDDTKQPQEALQFFKQAIYVSPDNLKARYNYELLLKRQNERQINPEQDTSEDENQEEENNDNNSNSNGGNSEENTTEGGGEGSGDANGGSSESENGEKEDKPSPQVRLDKLEDMNLNPEKAEMILDAMKNQEIQYHQQRTREPKKARKTERPNW